MTETREPTNFDLYGYEPEDEEPEGVSEDEFATALMLLLVDAAGDGLDLDRDDPPGIESASTFDDAGLLTMNKGVVVRLTDRSEFQITIVRSR